MRLVSYAASTSTYPARTVLTVSSATEERGQPNGGGIFMFLLRHFYFDAVIFMFSLLMFSSFDLVGFDVLTLTFSF